MRLLKKNDILKYLNDGTIDISDLSFLDDFRIGLSLSGTYYKLTEPIVLSNLPETKSEILCKDTFFTKNNLYLLESQQHLRISDNIIGVIQTRSKFARLGLELAQSSLVIMPSFGMKEFTPLIFEFSPRVNISGITTDEFYGYFLLFEIDSMNSQEEKDYKSRFPFNISE